MKLALSRISELLQATGEFDGRAVAIGYSIDSRSIQHGDLFFAVKGERLDGHDYVEAALAAGAVAAVVRKDAVARYCVKSRLLAVDDTLTALQCLGAAVRRIWGKKLIAITGSAGKTTTKETIAHVLAAKLRVHKSRGNFNNHFGLPLNLLQLEPEHEIAVLELGMSHAGEITELARQAQPNVGVVTNVAPVHLEFFDSIGGIARAKYELIESLPSHGTAILNADDEYVSQFGRDFKGKVVTYGIRRPADISAQRIDSLGAAGSEFDVIVDGLREHTRFPLVGEHNVLNALAAVAVALQFGFTPSDAVTASVPWLLWKSAEKSARSAAQPSSTIVTIPIRRLSKQWLTRCCRSRRSGTLLSPAKCWSSGQRAPTSIASADATWPSAASRESSVCAVWRKTWSRALAKPALHRPSSSRHLKKQETVWPPKRNRATRFCSRHHAVCGWKRVWNYFEPR